MTPAEKQVAVDEINASFAAASAAFLVDYKGCTCKELTDLRRDLRESGARMKIVKNTLTKRALADFPYSGLGEKCEGPTAVVWTGEDPVTPAKVVTKFAKDVEAFEVKAGVFDGNVVEANDIQALAKLPSKEELYAKLLALLQTPATKLVQTLDAPGSQIARLLEAWRTERETKGE